MSDERKTWIDNLQLAREKWLQVPPEEVIPGLLRWRSEWRADAGPCGLACFGGHLAAWPEFQALGVYTGPGGEPRMFGWGARQVSKTLFGSAWLFVPRNECEGDIDIDDMCTDHELVLRRIDKLIAQLQQPRIPKP